MIALVTTVDAGAKGASMPSTSSSASPMEILLSRTMSQWSRRNPPELWRDRVPSAYATEVTPMTFSPSARAFSAISTGRALRPESEMITRTSPDFAGLESSTAPARPSTRSRAEPRVAGMTSTPRVPGTASTFMRASPPAR